MKPGEMDYYEVLGLKPGASKEEVGTAYRKKSLRVHPDRYKGDDPEAATAEFMRLTTAKEVLLDDKARAAFEALQSARDAHRAKQEAQQAGRKKMREALEEMAGEQDGMSAEMLQLIRENLEEALTGEYAGELREALHKAGVEDALGVFEDFVEENLGDLLEDDDESEEL